MLPAILYLSRSVSSSGDRICSLFIISTWPLWFHVGPINHPLCLTIITHLSGTFGQCSRFFFFFFFFSVEVDYSFWYNIDMCPFVPELASFEQKGNLRLGGHWCDVSRDPIYPCVSRDCLPYHIHFLPSPHESPVGVNRRMGGAACSPMILPVPHATARA